MDLCRQADHFGVLAIQSRVFPSVLTFCLFPSSFFPPFLLFPLSFPRLELAPQIQLRDSGGSLLALSAGENDICTYQTHSLGSGFGRKRILGVCRAQGTENNKLRNIKRTNVINVYHKLNCQPIIHFDPSKIAASSFPIHQPLSDDRIDTRFFRRSLPLAKSVVPLMSSSWMMLIHLSSFCFVPLLRMLSTWQCLALDGNLLSFIHSCDMFKPL